MKEIFKKQINEEYLEAKKEIIKNDIYHSEESFINKLYKIDVILNSNLDFANKVIKIRDNKKTKNQYDEEYIYFIRLYGKVVSDFVNRLKKIIDKNILKPSFILDLNMYSNDISTKILHEIVVEKKNLQLLEMKSNKFFKENKRYADELYVIYCNYNNSINAIKNELTFKKVKKLK